MSKIKDKINTILNEGCETTFHNIVDEFVDRIENLGYKVNITSEKNADTGKNDTVLKIISKK